MREGYLKSSGTELLTLLQNVNRLNIVAGKKQIFNKPFTRSHIQILKIVISIKLISLHSHIRLMEFP